MDVCSPLPILFSYSCILAPCRTVFKKSIDAAFASRKTLPPQNLTPENLYPCAFSKLIYIFIQSDTEHCTSIIYLYIQYRIFQNKRPCVYFLSNVHHPPFKRDRRFFFQPERSILIAYVESMVNLQTFFICTPCTFNYSRKPPTTPKDNRSTKVTEKSPDRLITRRNFAVGFLRPMLIQLDPRACNI